MAFTVGLAIDAASGLVLIAFGVLLLLNKARTRATIAFAAFGIAFGLRAMANNIAAILDAYTLAQTVVEIVLLTVAAVGLAMFCLNYPTPLARADLRKLWLPIAVMTILSVVGAVILVPSGQSGLRFGLLFARAFSSFSVAWVSVAGCALAALRYRPPPAPGARSLAIVAASLLLWPTVTLGNWLGFIATLRWFQGPFEAIAIAWVSIGFLAASAAWAWTAIRTHSNAAWLLCWAAIASLALGAGLVQVIGPTRVADSGEAGVARTLMVLLIVYAVAGKGLVTAPVSVRRGMFATSLLAVLFIVAQIVQNVLAAEYGLLMGGIVAGLLLFAAVPIQRALEGLATKHSSPSDRLFATYRRAVRHALRGNRLTQKEEVYLAELAQRLGIGAADALRIRQDLTRAKRSP